MQEFDVEPGDRSTINYDALAERLNIEGDPPTGMIVLTAGFTEDDVFRVLAVWETQEDAERFAKERLQPLMEEGPVDPTRTDPPNRDYSYELHHVVRPTNG